VLLANESSDGRDGDLIAEQIDQQIPEEHALAEKHRELRLANRLSNIAKASRLEVENLVSLLRKRNRNEEAIQALRQWIKSHESVSKSDGVVGRLQLADEYLALLNDEFSAVENLKEAYSIEPNFEAVRSKLTSLGYRWDGVRWSKLEVMPRDVSNPLNNSPNGIHLGMTATDLRTLLGQPSSLLRAISARGVTEVWAFGPKGSTQLIVRLELSSRDTEPKITAFSGQ
jgi:tetratricopeptide (TPR) repeat protein